MGEGAPLTGGDDGAGSAMVDGALSTGMGDNGATTGEGKPWTVEGAVRGEGKGRAGAVDEGRGNGPWTLEGEQGTTARERGSGAGEQGP